MSEPWAHERCADCKLVRLFYYQGEVCGVEYTPCKVHDIAKGFTTSTGVALKGGGTAMEFLPEALEVVGALTSEVPPERTYPVVSGKPS